MIIEMDCLIGYFQYGAALCIKLCSVKVKVGQPQVLFVYLKEKVKECLMTEMGFH